MAAMNADPQTMTASSDADALIARAVEQARAAVGLPEGTRIVAAMSGGVDSTVTAALLARAGYDVVGVTLQLYDHGAAISRKGACCAGQDILDARMAAERIGIPHYVLDYESRFREQVIEDFADAYLRGETPIPCVRCNQTVKFRDLLDVARDLGAEAMATGHYVQRGMPAGANRPQLRRAADPAKDQSYFLFATTPAQLAFLRFPLGAMGKEEARSAARRLGLPVAAKKDSQDICFVPVGRYATVVANLRPEADRPGEIVDASGQVLGRHRGIGRFTVGQRRGLGVPADKPLYVVAIEPERAQVVVGPEEALLCSRIQLREVNWLGDEDLPVRGLPVRVKLRSTMPLVDATVTIDDGGRAGVELASPQKAIAPGQACVFYRDDRVLGGGFILRAFA